MPGIETDTVAEAARRWSLDIGVQDDMDRTPKWWSFKVFGFNIYCYNFDWRQRALAHHDLHHIVTGYPCTMTGEIQLATWEFAAGRFPNIYANLFCLPLVALGLFVAPIKLWEAFKFGRRSRSLFDTPITSDLLGTQLSDVRALAIRDEAGAFEKLDHLGFCGLVGIALVQMLVPVLAIAALLVGYTT